MTWAPVCAAVLLKVMDGVRGVRWGERNSTPLVLACTATSYKHVFLLSFNSILSSFLPLLFLFLSAGQWAYSTNISRTCSVGRVTPFTERSHPHTLQHAQTCITHRSFKHFHCAHSLLYLTSKVWLCWQILSVIDYMCDTHTKLWIIIKFFTK